MELSPVTGTPACWGYLAIWSVKTDWDTTPITPLEMASCTPVAAEAGLVWSSMTSGTSLWPFTPPLAFCAESAASNTLTVPMSCEAAAPVCELM